MPGGENWFTGSRPLARSLHSAPPMTEHPIFLRSPYHAVTGPVPSRRGPTVVSHWNGEGRNVPEKP